METTQDTKQVMAAIGTVQEAVGGMAKDDAAETKMFTTRFHSLNLVLSKLKPACRKEGLVFMQGGAAGGGVTTRITHLESGEWVQTIMDLPPSKQDPQAGASAVTYGRRIALCAAFGICETKDDDGMMASGAEKPESAMEEMGQLVQGMEDGALSYFIKVGWLKTGQELKDLSDRHARSAVKRSSRFTDAVAEHMNDIAQAESIKDDPRPVNEFGEDEVPF